MAGSFTPTGSYSNLTRLELEQLRKADFFAGGKGLTVGDSALPPEGVVGKGDINAEPYFTGESILLDDVYGITPPTLPGPGLGTLTTTQGVPSETVRWFGPTHIFDSSRGTASAAGQWSDNTPALNFTLFVQPGDLLLVKPNPAATDSNASVVGTITVVAASTLTVSNIFNPNTLTTTFDTASAGTDRFPYVIVRPTALPLFAVPGSGPVGREQTFLAVIPGSTVISDVAPTLDVINSERVKNIVPPFYSGTTSVDRADFVFDFGTPRIALTASLQTLGYRIVLYPDLGNGTGPDLTRPIATLNPIIDPGIPAADSRMTFDYKAGIIRFSDAPALGGDIKRPGGTNSTNPTTGRLNLYAVYWAVDQSFTQGAARSLFASRSDNTVSRTPGKVFWDAGRQVWSIGHTTSTNFFTVSAPDPTEAPDASTAFGTFDPVNSTFDPIGSRYFVYRQAPDKGNVWKFKRGDSNSLFDLPSAQELVVADKTAYTMGDGSAPPVSPGGDLNPIGLFNIGYRNLNTFLSGGLLQMASSGYGTFHLRRGKYLSEGGTVYVPPGILIEGEGAATSIEARANGSFIYNPIFKFGPNTPWGVFDFDYDSTNGNSDPPDTFSWTPTTRLEGMATVWNPVRRVWGVVQADATTNAIYFNEVNTNGLFALPGLGMEIKQSAVNLFTVNSPNAFNHTGAHYPRIAHHNSQDEYLIIWAEEYNPGGGIGPQVAWQILNRDFSVVTSIKYVRKFLANQYPVASGTYRNHPSIAVDNSQSNAGFGYSFAICYEAYTGLGTRSSVAVGIEVIASSNGITLNSTTDALTGQNIVTSTDVSCDDQGNYLFVYSVHRHQLWYSTTGVVIGGGNTLTDAGAVFNTNTVASFVQAGSRVLVLASTGATKADQGRSGVVGQVSGPTTISVIFDEHPGGITLFTENATFTYAVVPVSWIQASYLDNTGTFSTGSAVLAGDATVTSSVNYNTFEREPDFVRISRGSDAWLVAYQTFDTTAYFSHTFSPNFDNQINQAFHDNPSGVPKGLMSSLVPQRQHISTCYVMVGMFGVPMAPSNTNAPGYASPLFGPLGMPANEQVITARSLGGRHVNIPYPDALSTTERFELQISARNYTYPWKATSPQRPTSLIPAVTWSGSDWVVVSPSVNRIESDTGTYLEDPPASGNFWLIDPTFYFGDGNASPIDGSFLQNTVATGVDQIFFPSATVGSQYQTISAISSEHVIALPGAVPGLVSGTTYSWKLIRGDGANTTTPNGIKHPGFRVSPQGDVVVSSSYFTFADSISDSDFATPRQTETLSRLLWGETQPKTLDANFNPTIRYGASYPSWNDIVPSSRLKVDLTFQGVGVGVPKGCNETLDEPPMVAIAWGENFYGCLDRQVQGPVGSRLNQVTLHRQSFGPWNSGLADLALIGGKNNQTFLSQEHVFTRHGYTASANSGFATDGYRNCHVHLSYRFIRGMQDTLSPQFDASYSGDARDDTTYVADISAVYTDATGRNPIRVRGPLFAESPEREPFYGAVGNGGQFTPFLQGLGNKFLNTATPKVLWNGQKFVAFVPGALQKLDTSPHIFSGGPAVLARVQSTITMVTFPGDENRNSVDDALTGDSEISNPAFFFNNIRSPKITSVSLVTCGLTTNYEAAEFTVIDVAYSGHTYCVVWSMGHNNTAAKPTLGTNPGGNVIGYTLFKESSGNTIPFGSVAPSTFTPGSAPSFLIEATGISYANSYGGKARFRDPKVVWNGKSFVVTFLHLDDFDGNTGADIIGLHATVTAQGPLIFGGLTGSTSDLVGKTITVSGAAQPANNGVFFITAAGSGSVTVNTTGVFPDGNSGSIHWIIADLAVGPMGRYLRQIVIDENGNGIQPQLKATAGSASLGTIDPVTGGARALGRVVSQGFAGVNLVLDSTYANNHVQPGDLLVVTNAVQYGSVGGPFLQAGTQGVNLSAGGGIMQLSDSPSSSFTAVNVDNCYITISHANGGLNNGTFPITSYISATTIQYANSSGVTDPIGSTASITAAVGGIATITGLTGINEACIGGIIEIVGAASGGNNGFFVITAIGPGPFVTSLQYFNPSAVAPDANNGAITWATLATWTIRRGTAEFSGTYPVMDYDPSTHGLQLGAGFFAGNIDVSHFNSILLYGHIISGGAGTPRDTDLNSWNAGPNSSATRIFSLFAATASNTISKYWACVYNDRKDEYLFVVEALVGGVSSICLMTLRAADGVITNEVVGAPAATVTNATAAYNGDRYLVALTVAPTPSTAEIAFLSWSDNLGFDVGAVINSTLALTTLVGNGNRQAPGAGYDALDFALDPIPQFQKIDLSWNNRLNRWVASISVLWTPTTPVVDDVYHANFSGNWGVGAIVFTDSQTVSTYTNRTLTLSGASTLRQPGTRVFAQREETVYTQLFAGAQEYYSETIITDLGGVDFIASDVVIGDVLIRFDSGGGDNSDLHRTIAFVTPTQLLITGTFSGTNNNSAHGYQIRRVNRSQLTSNDGGTVTYGVNHVQDTNRNFGTFNVAAGDRLYINGNILVFVTAVFTTTNPNDTISFTPNIPAPANGTHYTVQRNAGYLFNIVKTADNTHLTIDAAAQEQRTPTFLTLAGNLYRMPREDVFVVTLGNDAPAVRIEDADQVYLQNVDVSGPADVEERYINLARPIYQVGGMVYGKADNLVGTGAVAYRPRPGVAFDFLTPVNKVETVRLTNVRSKARAKYGWGLDNGARRLDRYTSGRKA